MFDLYTHFIDFYVQSSVKKKKNSDKEKFRAENVEEDLT